MPLPMPNLDDRRFQDLVDEAKRRIPHYCPEWTDHNVSDPGVTLIELFAWMTELLIYRVNQVPEKSYITFLDLMGVQLQPATAARTALTFWLSAPAAEPVAIPAGSEASTVQTAAEPAVSFLTDTELTIRVPALGACLTSPDERAFEDQTWRLTIESEQFLAFEPRPRPGNAFYLGYTQDLSSTILELQIDCTIEGIGVNPANAPLAWEVRCADGWTEAELERDDTGGLNREGRVILHIPPRMARYELHGRQAFWVRCRYTPPGADQPDYSASPRINTLRSAAIGGTVSATHATTIAHELLGRGDGKPGQQFKLEHTPVLRLAPGEQVDVQGDDGEWQPWSLAEHFGDSQPHDRHFTLDNVSGELRFGPVIREPNGGERQYGAAPPAGRLVRFSRYRFGGGAPGNVGAGTVTVLKSSIPYVDKVVNRRPASGGRDAETLDHAKLRAPQLLRTRFRAVAADDYEALALEASSQVARARCLQPRALGAPGEPPPGTVQVLLVPAVARPAERLTIDQLRPAAEMIRDVQRYLDERRLLTTIVRVEQPHYVEVAVQAQLKARPEANLESVRREAAARLYRFLNPLVGGSEGSGWPFGRDLYISEVYTVLQNTPGVAYIEQVQLQIEGQPAAQARIAVPAGGLILSAEHQIEVV